MNMKSDWPDVYEPCIKCGNARMKGETCETCQDRAEERRAITTVTLAKLRDLLQQATNERSHYYVASVVLEAIAEIESLRHALDCANGEGQ